MAKEIFLSFLLIILVEHSYANPSPINIEINKTTLDKIRKVHDIVFIGENSIAGYREYSINIKNLNVNSLLYANVGIANCL